MSEQTDGQFDISAFSAVIEHSADLKGTFARRDEVNLRMYNKYWMIWSSEESVKDNIGKDVKITKSPRARNALKGAIWLLTAADPYFSVPKDINDSGVDSVSSNLERHAKAAWHAAGRIRGNPIHYDMAVSGLTFAEVIVGMESTKDLVDWSKGANPAAIKRMEYFAEQTPFLYHPYSPLNSYPELGPYGLEALYRTRVVKAGTILDTFGDRGRLALEARGDYTRYTSITLNEFVDQEYRYVWLADGTRPIMQAKHELPTVPAVAMVIDGSTMFDQPEFQREPFLYTLDKSGLLERENLSLTVMYTLTYALGTNPLFKYTAINPGAELNIDRSRPGNTIKLRMGERYERLDQNVIDPSLLQTWQIAADLEEQSTIYRQSLGQPLGASSPYSSVALLGQSGRLSLTTPQRKLSWAIGELMQKSYQWMKAKKINGRAQYYDEDQRNASIDVLMRHEEIPDNVQVVAKLDIAMPQDKLTQANIVTMLGSGPDPAMSMRWLRENIMQEGQSDTMTDEIYEEKLIKMFYDQAVQEMLMRQQMAQQQAMQAAAGGMQGAPAPGMEQMMPPGAEASPEVVGPADVNANPFPPATPYPPIRGQI